jgi:UDP-glucuronate decarboxylase
VLCLMQELLGLGAVTSHVIVIGCARAVHFVDRLYDMIVHLVEIVPIVDLIGQGDGTRPDRHTRESDEESLFHGVSLKASYIVSLETSVQLWFRMHGRPCKATAHCAQKSHKRRLTRARPRAAVRSALPTVLQNGYPARAYTTAINMKRIANRKRVLVTGGAGFLGSHLCERLLDVGDDVICVDNFYSATKDNITHLLEHPHFELLRHDVTFPLYVEVDEIYNLACPASPIHYQLDPVQTTKTSVHGAINMLGLAKRVKAKILQASTSEVYGDPEVHPQTESYWGHVNPIGVRACYDEGKRCAETLFFDYYRQHGLDIKVVRLFNTYGPRMHPHDGRVVSNFISQALQNEAITIYGDGQQSRSFCYVDDSIEAILRFMATSAGQTGPINVGNPHEHTVLELAKRIIELTGSSASIAFLPLPSDDPKQRRPDISRAQELLDWNPRIGIDDGLQRTIDYFRSR